MGGACEWPGIVGGSKYYDRTNNWNAVCTSGMVIASLALIGDTTDATGLKFDTQKRNSNSGYTTTYDVPLSQVGGKPTIHEGLATYSDYSTKLIAMNLETLKQYGMDQSYVLDGSYVESPSYWSYGTNSLFKLVAALTSATGTDYGLYRIIKVYVW